MLSMRLAVEYWVRLFRRNLFSWVEEEVRRLTNILRAAPPLNQLREDSVCWKFDPSNKFAVTSLYKQWEVFLIPKTDSMALTWKNAAPPRVWCLGWLAYPGKIKTSELLMRLGIMDSQSDALCV